MMTHRHYTLVPILLAACSSQPFTTDIFYDIDSGSNEFINTDGSMTRPVESDVEVVTNGGSMNDTDGGVTTHTDDGSGGSDISESDAASYGGNGDSGDNGSNNFGGTGGTGGSAGEAGGSGGEEAGGTGGSAIDGGAGGAVQTAICINTNQTCMYNNRWGSAYLCDEPTEVSPKSDCHPLDNMIPSKTWCCF